MFTVEEIQEKIKGSPNGCTCSFIKLSNEWGLKVYQEQAERDIQHTRQTAIAKHGLAPQTGEKFDIGGQFFAFVTQVAIPLLDGCRYGSPEYDVWEEEFDKLDTDKTIDRMAEELTSKLRKLGFPFYDNHICNIGMLNKMLVCIDFGG